LPTPPEDPFAGDSYYLLIVPDPAVYVVGALAWGRKKGRVKEEKKEKAIDEQR